MKQKESTIVAIANEVLMNVSKWANAEATALSIAAEKRDRGVAAKASGRIAGLMDCAVLLSWHPGECLGRLIDLDDRLEADMGKTESASDLLFLHGKQRSVQKVIRELQDLVVVSSAPDENKDEDEDDDEDDDEDVEKAADPAEPPADAVQAAVDAVEAERAPAGAVKTGAGHPRAKRADSETVLQRAYEWGEFKDGVDIEALSKAAREADDGEEG